MQATPMSTTRPSEEEIITKAVARFGQKKPSPEQVLIDYLGIEATAEWQRLANIVMDRAEHIRKHGRAA